MKWSDISTELSLYLDDESKTSATEALRIASFNRAQQYFAVTHTAKPKSTSFTLTDGQFDIPGDMIELAAVYVYDPQSQKTYSLDKAVLYWSSPSPTNGFRQDALKITVLDSLVPNSQITTGTLYYFGAYADITGAESAIELPVWSTWPVMNLAIAYCLYPAMVGQADIRRFQSKREAGSPEDNPPRKQAEFFINMYRSMLAGFPIQDRQSGYNR